MSFFKLILVSLFLATGLGSCMKTINQISVSQLTEAQEVTLLAKYIAKFHPGLAPKSSGLYFIETKAAPSGSDSIKVGDFVNVYYSGFLISESTTGGVLDGYNFDSSGLNYPVSFVVGAGRVIPGWEEGVTYMKNGSEAKLIIPSKLAYYNQHYSAIPPYSTLVFYVRIIKSTL